MTEKDRPIREPDDAMTDEVMSVIASFAPDELVKFAKYTGKPVAVWETVIANWKAERLQ